MRYLFLCLLLVSCSPAPGISPDDPNTKYVAAPPFGGGALQMHQLKDGTRCLVYTTGHGAALDCDWK